MYYSYFCVHLNILRYFILRISVLKILEYRHLPEKFDKFVVSLLKEDCKGLMKKTFNLQRLSSPFGNYKLLFRYVSALFELLKTVQQCKW